MGRFFAVEGLKNSMEKEGNSFHPPTLISPSVSGQAECTAQHSHPIQNRWTHFVFSRQQMVFVGNNTKPTLSHRAIILAMLFSSIGSLMCKNTAVCSYKKKVHTCLNTILFPYPLLERERNPRIIILFPVELSLQ